MRQADTPAAVTALLLDWRTGNREALEALTPIVYRELKRIASAAMRRAHQEHTLQPTALVNEAYLRLVARQLPEFSDRTHFFALSARIMRQVLVDSARSRHAAKRDAGVRVPFEESLAVGGAEGGRDDILALNGALEKLAATDERRARILELRYFGGMELAEIAESAGVSLATVKRDIALGEGWLRRAMKNAGPAVP
jgi:RNA polymerase sigma-70 factor, ECF subfamily